MTAVAKDGRFTKNIQAFIEQRWLYCQAEIDQIGPCFKTVFKNQIDKLCYSRNAS